VTPGSGDVPLTVALDASGAVDPDGTILSYGWDHGDGTSSTGVNSTHTYAAAGSYTVTLTVRDDDGATATTTRTVTVTNLSPGLTGVRVVPSAFAPLPSGNSIVSQRSRGATVRYTLSEAARVRFSVQRRTTGRRVGRRCVKTTRRNRSRRRCTRFVSVRGSFTHAGAAGRNRFRFSGRVRRRALRRGRYRLVARATDAAGNRSNVRRAGFRIVRRR
jgi:PKD domain